MVRTDLSERNEYLSMNPILSRRCPDWGEDLVFYVVSTSRGATLVLSYDVEHAIRAATIQWGRASNPEALVVDGEPMTLEYPIWCGAALQYLDAVILLEGDPMGNPPMRGPDSAPALSLGAAMLSCVINRQQSKSREGRLWEGELDNRDRYLRKNRLHIMDVINATAPVGASTLIPPPKRYFDPQPTTCTSAGTGPHQNEREPWLTVTLDAYPTQRGVVHEGQQCEVIGDDDFLFW